MWRCYIWCLSSLSALKVHQTFVPHIMRLYGVRYTGMRNTSLQQTVHPLHSSHPCMSPSTGSSGVPTSIWSFSNSKYGSIFTSERSHWLPSNPNSEPLGPSEVVPSLISSLSRSFIILRPGLGCCCIHLSTLWTPLQLHSNVPGVLQNMYYGGVNIFHHYNNFHLQILVFQFI